MLNTAKLLCYRYLILSCFILKYNSKNVRIAGPVYLEQYLENIKCKNVSSSVTVSNEVNIDSIKIFALNDFQQAFILSGPENRSERFVHVYISITYEIV